MLATRTLLCAEPREFTRFVETHGDEAARTLIGDDRLWSLRRIERWAAERDVTLPD